MINIGNIVLLFVLLGCIQSRKSPREIYESGQIDDWSSFYQIDNSSDSLVDVFIYKHDTAFMVKKHYGENRGILSGYSFYYNSLKEGKWIIRDYYGKLLGESNFKNGKYDGFQITYNRENGTLRNKEFYKNGVLIYEVTYSKKGEFLDSVSYDK